MLSAAKKEFIEFMMSADVLRFGSFVTKSGRQTRISSIPATIKPACKTRVWANFMPLRSKKLWAQILMRCLARPIRVSRSRPR